MTKKYLFKVLLSATSLLTSPCIFAQTALIVQIAEPNGDAEELVGESVVGPAGSAYLDSSDLELTEDAETTQIVGLRFTDLDLVPGTKVTRAYVQFTVDEATSEPASLSIYGEASDAAAAFSDASGMLSSRAPTAARVSWSPAPWEQTGQAAEAQQTPDLSSLIQEIIDRPGWQSGNPLVIMFSGEGKRVAESFEGSSSAAATLLIEYESPETQAETPSVQPETSEDAPSQALEAGNETVNTEVDDPEVAAETSNETTTTDASSSETATTATPGSETETAGVITTTDNLDPAKGRRYTFAGDGVTGSVLVTNYGNDTVILTVLVSGQAAGDVYGARLNLGSCSAPGELLLDLEPVRADRGSLSVTSSKVDFATLTQADLNFTLLRSPDSNETVACGEVGAL